MATTPTSPTRYCSQCGRPASEEELARFGEQLVCADCKSAYAQKLREGVVPQFPVAGGTGYRYGGFWVRVVAVFIDGLILLVVNWGLQYGLIFPLVGFKPVVQPASDEPLRVLAGMFAVFGFSMLLSTALGSCYEAFFLARLGATPGKMVFSMKVVRPDGARLVLAVLSDGTSANRLVD